MRRRHFDPDVLPRDEKPGHSFFVIVDAVVI
jgi:hypothetical protein